jgi:hypothetical protein
MEYTPSNTGTLEDDCRRLIGNLMRELCQKDANARNNGLPNDFALEEMQNIGGYDNDFKRTCIQRFQAQRRYLDVLQNGRITLTEDGRQHCNEY